MGVLDAVSCPFANVELRQRRHKLAKPANKEW
jgi:hypothetical protein